MFNHPIKPLDVAFFVLGYLQAIKIATSRRQSGIRLLAMLSLVLFFTLPARAQQTIVLGPLHGDLGVQAGFQYTDNISNTSSNKQSDLSLLVGPTFNGGLTLPVHFGSSMSDEMTLGAGVSYQEQFSVTSNYMKQTFNSPVNVNLMIPVRVYEWKVTISDSFSFDNTSLDSAVLAGQQQVEQYINTASINAERNFGKAGISLGVERIDKFSSLPSNEETDYQLSVSPYFTLRENYKLFWTTTYGLVFPSPNDPTRQNVESITSEVGVSGQITPAFNGSISLGYGLSHLYEKRVGSGSGIFGGIFDPIVLPQQNFSGISSSIAGSYTHPLHPNTSYSISAYRSPGVTALISGSSVQAVTGVSLGLAHKLSSTLTLAPVFQWTYIESLGISSNHERENLFSMSIALSRQLTSRLSASIQYQYVSRMSSIPGNTFDVTQITGQANYRF